MILKYSCFLSVTQACKRFEIESKLKKFKNFPLSSAASYANALKNNVNEIDNGHDAKHELIGEFSMNFEEYFKLIIL